MHYLLEKLIVMTSCKLRLQMSGTDYW